MNQEPRNIGSIKDTLPNRPSEWLIIGRMQGLLESATDCHQFAPVKVKLARLTPEKAARIRELLSYLTPQFTAWAVRSNVCFAGDFLVDVGMWIMEGAPAYG